MSRTRREAENFIVLSIANGLGAIVREPDAELLLDIVSDSMNDAACAVGWEFWDDEPWQEWWINYRFNNRNITGQSLDHDLLIEFMQRCLVRAKELP